MRKGSRYSNGNEIFTIIDSNEVQTSLYSETGVSFLDLKEQENCNISSKSLIDFLNDEMSDFKEENL